MRCKGHKAQTSKFPTKTAAKMRADRIERELAELEARDGSPADTTTPAELIDSQTGDCTNSGRQPSMTHIGNPTCLRRLGQYHGAGADGQRRDQPRLRMRNRLSHKVNIALRRSLLLNFMFS